MKAIVFLICIIAINSFSAKSQTDWKVGAYDTFEDFLNREPTDSFEVRVKPVKDKYIPQLCKVIPVSSFLPQTHINRITRLIYDGNALFLNLLPLRISKGYIEFESPKSLNFFLGRPQFDEVFESSKGWRGATGPISRGGTENDTYKSVPYLFDLRTNKIHPFIAPTMQRMLEPFPEIANLYEKDPQWKTLETMQVYLEILNELLEAENQ